MIDLNIVINENKVEHNQNRPYIPDQTRPYTLDQEKEMHY